MPALMVCLDAALAVAASGEILSQCVTLRAVGVDLLWLAAGASPAPGFAVAGNCKEMERAWDQALTPAAVWDNGPPAWVAVAIAQGDFDRVLILADGEHFAPAESAAASQLTAAGAEGVELAPLAGLEDLTQSWISGRRTRFWSQP